VRQKESSDFSACKKTLGTLALLLWIFVFNFHYYSFILSLSNDTISNSKNKLESKATALIEKIE
jgi:hypothetical protein